MEIKGLCGLYQGQSIKINREIIVGRDPENCSLIYPSGTDGISRIHCSINIIGDQVIITDLGSSYGTFVNGKKLAANIPTTMKNGDTFYIGNTDNQFMVSDGIIPATTAPKIINSENSVPNKNAQTVKNNSGQKNIVECNPHWVSLLKYILLCILFIFLGLKLHPVFLLGFLITVVLMVIVVKSTKLCLSSEAVIGKIGVLNTKEMMSPIRNVQDVSISQDLPGKIFGYATITVSTAGSTGTEYVFKTMSNCFEFRNEFIKQSALK